MKNHQRFLLFALIVVINACGGATDDPAHDYARRVQNILELESLVETPGLNQADIYPRPKALALSYPEQDLSIREFLSMRQCKLHGVIANKNSQLGKVAPASQVLFSELDILHYGPACVITLQADQQIDLANKLDAYLQSKTSLIEQYLWEAILGSAENASFWSRSNTMDNYPMELLVDPRNSIDALLDLVQAIKQQQYYLSAVRKTEIENALKDLSYADGGILLQHLSRINAGLAHADSMLELAIAKPLCFEQKPTQTAQYLGNVVVKFFIGQVQPQLVALIHRYQQIMPAYLQLETALVGAAPSAYQVWQRQRQQKFDDAINSAKRHVDRLKIIFAQCGLTIGAA